MNCRVANVRTLVEYGQADTTLEDKDGKTAEQKAAEMRDKESKKSKPKMDKIEDCKKVVAYLSAKRTNSS